MTQNLPKNELYARLKKAGYPFDQSDKQYRDWKTAELQAIYDQALSAQRSKSEQQRPAQIPHSNEPTTMQSRQRPPIDPNIPRGEKDPNERAGVRQNTKDADEPIRVDDQGRIWYQEEVNKPPFPKPRGRRVIDYVDPGVKEARAKNGEYLETFEIAGDEQRVSQVKITLPSYQVGKYKDPRYPFKIHCYNSNEGFDFFEVAAYYGGADLVPSEIQRVYVENVLCWDIRTTIRAIQTEYRQLQLQGKV